MATTVTIKIGLVDKGDYSSSATYQVLDMVKYNGITYLAKQDVPTGTVPTNTAYWSTIYDLPDGAVTTAKLADGAVTSAKLDSAISSKLNGIESGAEVNQNAFSNVKVGTTTVAADTKTDTLTLVAGDHITLTPNATDDSVTIAVAQGGTSVTDVTVNSNSVLDGTVAKIPFANANGYGVIKASHYNEAGNNYLTISTKVNETETSKNVPGLDSNSKILNRYLPSATSTEYGAIKSSIGTYAATVTHEVNGTDTSYSVPMIEKVNGSLTTIWANYLPEVTGSTKGAMSSSDKTKLDGIASGAEVNQNAFSNITVGSTTVSADSKTDTLTLVAGTNVTLTPDATNDSITISATGGGSGEPNQNAFSYVTVGSSTIAAESETDTLTLVAGTNVTLSADTTNDQVTISSEIPVSGVTAGTYGSRYLYPTNVNIDIPYFVVGADGRLTLAGNHTEARIVCSNTSIAAGSSYASVYIGTSVTPSDMGWFQVIGYTQGTNAKGETLYTPLVYGTDYTYTWTSSSTFYIGLTATRTDVAYFKVVGHFATSSK